MYEIVEFAKYEVSMTPRLTIAMVMFAVCIVVGSIRLGSRVYHLMVYY